jgi:cellobiose-specific phosphotransferase system component IIB
VVRAADGDSTFFLHFDLKANDLGHARELFGELSAALAEEGAHETARVLLTCTSAFTTSMFAAKMNEVASTLSLGYAFEALPLDEAVRATGTYAAIMVAPQAAYMRSRLAVAHPDALVFEIPPKLFGAYDAAGALRLLMHALHDDRGERDTNSLRLLHGMSNDYRVLVITLFSLRRGARLGYRLYHGAEVQAEGMAMKGVFNFRDIEDLIETMGVRGVDLAALDAIGIAVPGVTFEGMVSLPEMIDDDYDLGPHLAERFGLPVYVDNNCNAAVVGCYVSQNECESIAFFKQEFGHVSGGFGTVLNGRLVRGYLSQAGEPKYIESRFSYGDDGTYDDARYSAHGMFQIATNMCLASICMTAPEAIYLAVDTVDDLEALHDEIASVIGAEFVPVLELVDDYVGTVYLGEMALCIHRLQTRDKE